MSPSLRPESTSVRSAVTTPGSKVTECDAPEASTTMTELCPSEMWTADVGTLSTSARSIVWTVVRTLSPSLSRSSVPSS